MLELSPSAETIHAMSLKMRGTNTGPHMCDLPIYQAAILTLSKSEKI